MEKTASPPRWRLLENAHILLWLMKDVCWVTEFRAGGTLMIGPTLGMAVYFLHKQRHVRAEVFHNCAICLWIAANSVWMLGEFFQWPLRGAAIVLFLAGLATLIVYYIFFFRRDVRQSRSQ